MSACQNGCNRAGRAGAVQFASRVARYCFVSVAEQQSDAHFFCMVSMGYSDDSNNDCPTNL